MIEELQEFNINLEDIEENNYLFNNISVAVEKMKKATLKDRFEVVLNNNLIEAKDKYTGFRTILGCKITYDNLDKNISFVVREDNKPTYEELENIIKEVREYIEKDTRWFDSEYAKIYGELCTCAGANDTRLEVLVNPSNLLKILDKENNNEDN